MIPQTEQWVWATLFLPLLQFEFSLLGQCQTQDETGCWAGGVKKALLCLVEGVSDGRGGTGDISNNIYPVFSCVTPCPKLIIWTGSFLLHGKPRRQPDYVHFTDEDTEAQRGALAGGSSGIGSAVDRLQSPAFPQNSRSPRWRGSVGISTPRGHLAIFAGIFSCHSLRSATGF